MIRRSAVAAPGIAALAASHAAVYLTTREKWHELGRNTGQIQGKAELIQALAPLATPGAPRVPPAYSLTVKTSAIHLVPDGPGYRLYVQD